MTDYIETAFSDFRVGDVRWFEHSFEPADFEAFARLSGDRNPLHGNPAYAQSSEFKRPIVPLHLTAAPLSAIAGMHFPGEPSLYLGHELRAVKPVYFGDRLVYSARIIAIEPVNRVLTIRVIVLRAAEVLLEADMKVRSRLATWQVPAAEASNRTRLRPVALITGAAGAIGAATALSMARAGWDVMLHGRRADERLAAAAAACRGAGAAVDTIAADLNSPAELERLAAAIVGRDGFAALVHAASPGVDAGLGALTATNFTALSYLGRVALPLLLRRQEGHVVVIGSTATDHHPAGWEDYVAAKAMASTVTASIEHHYSAYGVRGLTIAPGFVQTPFSDALRPAGAAALLPEEVAAAVVDALSSAPRPYVVVEPTGRRGYGYGRERGERTPVSGAAPSEAEPSSRPERSSAIGLDQTVRSVLRLPPDADLASARLGETRGWDSLRHIELLLAVERATKVTFTAAEMDKTQSYEGLVRLVNAKTAF